MRISDWSSDVCSSDLKGFDGFYRGETANKLIKGVNDEGGKWTAEELAAYKVRERAPIVFEHDGWKITTAPPPSSGGIALAALLDRKRVGQGQRAAVRLDHGGSRQLKETKHH